MEIKEVIRKNAIINAYLHNGRADVNSVISKLIAEIPEVKQRIKEIIGEVKKIVEEVNKLSFKEIEEEAKKFEFRKKEEKRELPDLPNAEIGKVVMRLAPYPSGPLHIGNARMVILNDEYVKKYNGKLILFFDDTIGSEEKPIEKEAYEMIIEDLKWLNVNYSEIYYKSDRLEIYYKYAEEVIKKGFAYVCTCSKEEIRRNRKFGIECKCRNRNVEENLILWKKMFDEFKEGEAVLRIKTDMKHKDPAFRDRVIFRISEREHPRVGKKYRVWPLLEFSWAVDDYLIGTTHILRGKQLVIEDTMQEYIWKILNIKPVHFIHYGMMKIAEEGSKLSKSKCRELIKKGELIGWEDPRTWSLISLRKRGIKPEAIRKFILNMGLSLADVTVAAEILYAENRKIIDKEAMRYFLVKDPIEIEVENFDKNIREVLIPLHPEVKEKVRKIEIKYNKFFIEREDYLKNKGNRIGFIGLGSFLIKENYKAEFLTKEIFYEDQKIQWLNRDFVEVKILMPNGKIIKAIAEKNVESVKYDEIVQFIRFGFCRKDKEIFFFSHT
ncbi:MAG: glutamate--tRNA ligase [Candidatus Aenigmarchaeota archaeon]|nr:glutamate--tRNA ligase [Candidatus Aenigmarchaeota archaeon]MDW8149803.1 glutamate--tRNA ligase [Candidatus Aenigmarchaeota archaeon]